MKDRSPLLVALLLAGLAAAIRLTLLATRFAYIDDLLQLYAVTRLSLRDAARAMSGIGPLQPPLDYVTGFLAARLNGTLTFLRLLPVLWGVLTVPLAYRLGSRMKDRTLGLWLGLLLAVSMPLASFSVTLRPYSLSVLLGLLCWSAFEDLLAGEKIWPYAAGQALFQVAYPHAWLVGLTQLAFTARSRPQSLGRTARALIPSWLALASWLVWWHWAVPSSGGFHYDVPWSALTLIARSFNQAQWPALWLYPALAAWGATAAWKTGFMRDFTALAAATALFPLLAIFSIHRIEHVVLLPRHVLPLLPSYLALVAAGCAAATARPAAKIALATVLLAAAAGPLSALAAREAGLSAYLAEFVRELDRRAGPSDVLIFADPNTGATVLRELDPRAFDALAGIDMREGFALFRFPSSSRVGGRAAYTLCALDPALATADAALVRRLRDAKNTVWLVSLEGLNALPQTRPFASLALKDGDVVEEAPGLARLR